MKDTQAIARRHAFNIAEIASAASRDNINLHHLKSINLVTEEIEKAINEATAELQKERDELREDKAMLDWLEKAVIDDLSDPEFQFRSLKCGPFNSQLTLSIYNGRTTHGYTSEKLRVVLRDAMRKEGV